MGHSEKYLLRALNAKTAAVICKKLVYNRYTVECFAAAWHMNPKTRTANIYIDKELIYGYESPEFKLNALRAENDTLRLANGCGSNVC